ncbi:MAG: response regulator transcription factor [Eggerthia catenaformis]|uniref:response regulator transcription factor n=1 Tax=Eggerthia catenaformis TaxID=31973 RepID=UPI003C6EDAB4
MNNIPHILVIDDEKEICDLIEIYLTQESFQVFKAYDAVHIIEDIKEHSIDLVILDIMMPGIDGFQALELLRKNSNIPVIFLSAKTTEDDKVEGLLKGADDYIGKPFSSNELVARVKSQLRRYTVLNSPLKEETSIINANDLKIDIKRKIVTINDMPINLTRIEYNILVLLATHPETVYSTEDIFETIWNEKPTNADNTIMVHIRKLREKVERQPRNPRHIKTVWGIGYKFTL